MSQNFGTSIDLKGNAIKNAGLDVVSALPTTFLVEGREVIFQGEVFRYLNGEWRLNSFSAYSLKTYAELKALKDNNALVPGNQYVLTDFYTTYLAEDGETWLGSPDCEVIDHLGNPIISDNYHILLQATSENTFSPQAYIFNQPDSDKPYLRRMSYWNIMFDIDKDLFGRIIYMYDIQYNNTFDFDIFNLRSAFKGYQISMVLKQADIEQIGALEPLGVYYLWSIGDLGGCYESHYSIYDIYGDNKPYIAGVYNTSITQSSHIFIRIDSSITPSPSYNYYQSSCDGVTVLRSTYFITGVGIFSVSIISTNHFYSKQQCNHFTMTNSDNIISLSQFSRGLNIGLTEGFHNRCSYLYFYFPGSAYVEHKFFLAEYCTFLAKRAALTLIQPYSVGYPIMYCSTIINRNLNGVGGTNATLNFTNVQDTEFTFSTPNSGESVYAFSPIRFIGRKFSTPSDIITSPDEDQVFELETCENNTFLNYTDTNNENVRTSLKDIEIIDSFNVSFYDEFITNVLNTYFMPFGVFYDSPDAWGYEIEGVKYPTNIDLPILACVFCNSGTNRNTFAGKSLKFYVDYDNETFYSSEYTINSNGTLTKVS